MNTATTTKTEDKMRDKNFMRKSEDHWIMIRTQIFNFTNGSRKMCKTVMGFTSDGLPFTVKVRTQDEAETIMSQLMNGGSK